MQDQSYDSNLDSGCANDQKVTDGADPSVTNVGPCRGGDDDLDDLLDGNSSDNLRADQGKRPLAESTPLDTVGDTVAPNRQYSVVNVTQRFCTMTSLM